MYRYPKLGILVAVGAAFLIFPKAGFVGTKKQQAKPQANSPAIVINETQALQVISVADAGGRGVDNRAVKITLKNVSNKGVVEYIILKADGSEMLTSGATTGWELAPGESDAVIVSVESAGHETLTLGAALLEDGGGDGSPKYVKCLRDYRAGVEGQYKRAEPILRQMIDTVPGAPADVVEALQAKLSALPEPLPSEGISPDMASGFRHAKQFIKRQTQPSDNNHQNELHLEAIRSNVSNTLTQVERALEKFARETVKSNGKSLER